MCLMRTMKPLLQSLWIGERLNELARLSIASFIAHGHPYHLYTYKPVKNLPKGVTVMDANTILSYDQFFTIQQGFGTGSKAPFSNLFRYHLLHQRGGTWVDTDFICLKPWPSEPAIMIASEYLPQAQRQGSDTHTTSAILRFPAGDPFITHCLTEAEKRIAQGTLTWGVIGPKLIEETLKVFPEYQAYVLPPEACCSLNNWEVFRLIQPNSPWQPDPEALAVHCWHELWRYSMTYLNTLPWHKRLFYWLNPARTLHTDRHYPNTTPIGQWQAQYGVS